MTDDISRSGLSFKHSNALPVDSTIRILVAMSSPARTLTKLGRVCWTSPNGSTSHRIGVALTSVNRLDGAFWNSYVTERQRGAVA
jgi:hypothetical protein